LHPEEDNAPGVTIMHSFSEWSGNVIYALAYLQLGNDSEHVNFSLKNPTRSSSVQWSRHSQT